MEAKLKHECGWLSAVLEGLRPGQGGAGQCWERGPKPERAEASPGPSQLVIPVLAAWGKEQGQTRLVPACRHATRVCVCAFSRVCACVAHVYVHKSACVHVYYMCECAHLYTRVCVTCVYMRKCACIYMGVCVHCISVCTCACTCVCVCVSQMCCSGLSLSACPTHRCMGLTCLQRQEGPLLLVWEEEDVWKPGGAEMREAGWQNTWNLPGPLGSLCSPALCPDLPPA